MRRIIPILLLAGLAAAQGGATGAAALQDKDAIIFEVDSVADLHDLDPADELCLAPNGDCTLRAAVMQSNALSTLDVDIVLPAGDYVLSRMPMNGNGAGVGDLNLTEPAEMSGLTRILGAGAELTRINGAKLDRVFAISSERRVSIAGVTITGGFAPDDSGGAINNHGLLDLLDSVVADNKAQQGGGIANQGQLSVVRTTLQGNEATSYGGGIYNEGLAHMESSTLSNNQASQGAGVANYGSLVAINSTLSGNEAEKSGGGIYNITLANVYNSTLLANAAGADQSEAGRGGGVYSHPESGAEFNLRNTLLAGNYIGATQDVEECFGEIYSYGRNLIGDGADIGECKVFGSWEPVNALALIGPLQDNGGPTLTHALLSGSNAIDGGDDQAGCVDDHGKLIAFDQRGEPRVVDGDDDGLAWCDIGTFEYAQTQMAQTITFPTPPAGKVGDLLVLTAVASSGLPVAYRSDTPLRCAVSGATASLLAAGQCKITASQAGSDDYLPAPEVSVTFLVEAKIDLLEMLLYLPAVLK